MNNAFILNETAKNDSIIQEAIKAYTQRLQSEYEYSQKVRAGLITPQPTTSWNISDRHWNLSKIMKLYILKEVLYDYTDGMAVIAAESMPQCEQIFMEEFGYFTDCNGERVRDEQVQKEFNNAKVTIIESVGLDEAGIVEYVYGGG